MLEFFSDNSVPKTLQGPQLFDGFGVPRFWATVWASWLPLDAAHGSNVRRLRHLDRFYVHCDEVFGDGFLDRVLSSLDVSAIHDIFDSYFLRFRNLETLTDSHHEHWCTALTFVEQITERVSRATVITSQAFEPLWTALAQLQIRLSKLHVGRRRRPELVRSLPANIVEFLYEILTPTSQRNPFRREATRWRAFVGFLLLLHVGLRRGELLLLPSDCVKHQFSPTQERVKHWIAVRYNEYEEDTRYSAPSIKNAPSIRNVPVSDKIVSVVELYANNHRGRPRHSFLLNSQKHTPLSTEGLTREFKTINDSLPPSIKKELDEHTGKDTVTPHSFRHTCAVFRLNQWLRAGIASDVAHQNLRSYFGWSRSSEMPLRYARAAYEHRLAAVWNPDFDDRVDVLRSLSSRLSGGSNDK